MEALLRLTDRLAPRATVALLFVGALFVPLEIWYPWLRGHNQPEYDGKAFELACGCWSIVVIITLTLYRRRTCPCAQACARIHAG